MKFIKQSTTIRGHVFTEHPIKNYLKEQASLFDITAHDVAINSDFKIEGAFSHLHYCEALLLKLGSFDLEELNQFLNYQANQLNRPVNWLIHLKQLVLENKVILIKNDLEVPFDCIIVEIEEVINSFIDERFNGFRDKLVFLADTRFSMKSIDRNLSMMESGREKFNYLFSLMSTWNEQQDLLILAGKGSIGNQIELRVKRLKKEMKFKDKVGVIEERGGEVARKKLKTTFSVPELALLFRLLVEIEGFEVRNKTAWFELCAELLQSKQKDTISKHSFKNNFETPTFRALDYWEDKSLKMFNLVKQLRQKVNQ